MNSLFIQHMFETINHKLLSKGQWLHAIRHCDQGIPTVTCTHQLGIHNRA